MYTALIDPPYELAPFEPSVVALQLTLFTLLMETLTLLAVVNPDALLLTPLGLKLQAYPPKYTENDPPYTCEKTSHQRATHAQRQYDRGGDGRKALTLAPDELEVPDGLNSSAGLTRVRAEK